LADYLSPRLIKTRFFDVDAVSPTSKHIPIKCFCHNSRRHVDHSFNLLAGKNVQHSSRELRQKHFIGSCFEVGEATSTSKN
jgi:hypothetical protein